MIPNPPNTLMSPYHHHLTCQQVYCEKKGRKKRERVGEIERERKKERGERVKRRERERESNFDVGRWKKKIIK